MSYCISYHPVDLSFYHDCVIPFLQGKATLDDRLDPAARFAAVKARSSEWAIALSRLSFTEWEHLLPDHYCRDLHLLGRPFFITLDSPEEVSQAIDEYLNASLEEVDGIAKQMLDHFNPGLVDVVEPKDPIPVPTLDDLREQWHRQWAVYQRAYQQILSEEEFATVLFEERSHAAEDVIGSSLPWGAVALSSFFYPTWTTGGLVWPQNLLSLAELETEDFFQIPWEMLRPLMASLPEEMEYLAETEIEENCMLGGYVPPEKVALLRDQITSHQEKLETIYGAQEQPRQDMRIQIQLMQEALFDVQRRGMGFIEANDLNGDTLCVRM